MTQEHATRAIIRAVAIASIIIMHLPMMGQANAVPVSIGGEPPPPPLPCNPLKSNCSGLTPCENAIVGGCPGPSQCWGGEGYGNCPMYCSFGSWVFAGTECQGDPLGVITHAPSDD
jgi:hypothetical protein